MSIEDLLTPHQLGVASQVLAEESARRAHLVVHLSGAHAYGFPSPDSDLDLKAVHVAATRSLLGLHPPRPTFDRAEIVDGVEIDYTSNEIGHVLAGVLRGNGNFLERILGTTTACSAPPLKELQPIVRRALHRRFHAHYRGFAVQQRANLIQEPTVKRLLYVLRTTSTGIHLLRAGELVIDLTQLADEMRLRDVDELVERKRAGEQASVTAELVSAWSPRIDRLFEDLDAARDASPLPDEAPNEGELDSWLVELRRAQLG